MTNTTEYNVNRITTGNHVRTSELPVFVAVLLLLMAAPAIVQAQLSPAQIDSLREVGKSEGWTFEVSANEATQYSLDQLAGFELEEGWQESGRWADLSHLNQKSIPSRFDWRDSSALTPIRNQGGCNSCWAFATMACVESAILRRDRDTVDLSEQWLVSCNTSGWGCDFGGRMAFEYLFDRPDACDSIGAPLEADYPYTATQTPCDCNVNRRYRLHDWAYLNGSFIGQAGEVPMKTAILEYGPIAVALRIDPAFQAYAGGVFNACADGPANHALAIVGWDDTLGDNGVWILRNSWGDTWGDGGYMMLPFGCNRIGTAAAFADYRQVEIVPGTTLVAAPTVVQFEATAPGDTVLSCQWDFGDGAQSGELTPTHEFFDPGVYDVTVTVETPTAFLNKTAYGAVSLHADTFSIATVEVVPGEPVMVPVTMRQTLPMNSFSLPIDFDGPWNVTLDSVTLDGCRTVDFEVAVILEQDTSTKEARVFAQLRGLRDVPYLEAGIGPVINLWFTVPPGVSGDHHPIRVAPYHDIFDPVVLTYYGAYYPAGIAGALVREGSSCCMGSRGNIRIAGNCSPPTGEASLGDLTAMIDHLFVSFAPLCCDAEADVAPAAADGSVSLGDLSVLIDHLFVSFSPLPDCE